MPRLWAPLVHRVGRRVTAEFRKVNLAMQSDPEFRLLPPPAQHLYYTLWCHPSMTYAGVVDWRPGRIAATSAGWTAEDVTTAGACLEARHFIVTDAETEECLVRSWIRFDGLLKQPRLSVSFVNAFHSTSSNDIRGVIVHELNKHAEREPDLVAWANPKVKEITSFPAIDPKVRATVSDPFGDEFGHRFGPGLAQTQPLVSPSVSVPPTTSTATATSQRATSSSRRSPETPLPDEWAPNDKHRAFAEKNRLDLEREAFRFRNHAASNDRRQRDWNAAFANWLDKAQPIQAPSHQRATGIPEGW